MDGPRRPLESPEHHGGNPAETSPPGPRHFDSTRVRIWHGPKPHEGHRVLLQACLWPLPAAESAWNMWRGSVDFEHQDAWSYTLAANAVVRLGERAGSGSAVERCRGWDRRERLISSLAMAAAQRISSVLGEHGETCTAVGDLAEADESAPLPVRSIELFSTSASPAMLEAARQAARIGSIAAMIDDSTIPVVLGPGAAWHGRWLDARGEAAVGVEPRESPSTWQIPTRAERWAMALSRGWRWGSRDGLRWILTSHRMVTSEDPPDCDEVAACAGRDGSTPLLRAALRCLADLPGFEDPHSQERLDRLRRAVNSGPISWRDRWRSAKVTRPPRWWPARVVHRIRRPWQS